MINADKIVVISLRERTDRRKTSSLELKKFNLHGEYFLAERHPNPEQGCFLSHQAVCQQALADGCESLLVFEDDVRILSWTQAQIRQINDFIIRKSQLFDILYLGLILGKMWFCGQKSIVRAEGAGAHAYILSRSGMQKFASYPYTGLPIDRIFKLQLKGYCIYPMIVEQYPEDEILSDISPTRTYDVVKTKAFWQDNFNKQKWQLLKNCYRWFDR